MSDKKNYILRLDPAVFKLLEKWAADEFRSINGQLEWIVHQQLKAAGRMKKTEPEVEIDPEKTSITVPKREKNK